MKNIRIGLIGCGAMGINHARSLADHKIPNAELAAVCDTNKDNLQRIRQDISGTAKLFENIDEMLQSGSVDAIIVATPHYFHPDLAIKAFRNDLHVLIEKPAGVFTKNVREMNYAAEKSGKTFAIMFNQRTHPIHVKLKDIVQSGELGDIKRCNWITTQWYRPQSYYDAGVWRGTWKGEGGGILINQCPHQLDLWQWICGRPVHVHAFCSYGKYHNIEVEDDVTAYVRYANGATGVFIASTGEAPGSNRFEIAGDNGKIVMENDTLTFWRTRISERKFNNEYQGGFGEPESWKCEIAVKGEKEDHNGIIKNFVESILTGVPLIAPGKEGINSLEISNAMLLSSWLNCGVDLPVDDELFYEKLQEKIQTSTFEKDTSKVRIMDNRNTY